MRRMAFAVACTLLLSGPALGAAGDVLTVIGDGVNVRSGPGTEHSIRLQVSRNQRLVEIERQGDWVHAEIAGRGGEEGWIHGSLVAPPEAEPLALQPGEAEPAALADAPAPAQPLEDVTAAEPQRPAAGAATSQAPLATGAAAREAEPLAAEAIAPGAGLDIDPVDLERFRDSVAYLNSRSMSVGGFELFTEVEPLGGGAVQVGASDAWASIPPAGQRSYANTLLDRWAAATGRSDRVKVQIVDDSGQVIMEESKP